VVKVTILEDLTMLNNNEFRLPSGSYVIGDPINFFSEEEDFMEIVSLVFGFSECEIKKFNFTLYAFPAAYGQNEHYYDNEGSIYYCPSGILGIISWDDLQKTADENYLNNLKVEVDTPEGKLVAFDDEFICRFSLDKNLSHCFGEINIDTTIIDVMPHSLFDDEDDVDFDFPYDEDEFEDS